MILVTVKLTAIGDAHAIIYSQSILRPPKSPTKAKVELGLYITYILFLALSPSLIHTGI